MSWFYFLLVRSSPKYVINNKQRHTGLIFKHSTYSSSTRQTGDTFCKHTSVLFHCLVAFVQPALLRNLTLGCTDAGAVWIPSVIHRAVFFKPAFSRAGMEKRRYRVFPCSLYLRTEGHAYFSLLSQSPCPQQSYTGTVMAWGCCPGMNVPAVQPWEHGGPEWWAQAWQLPVDRTFSFCRDWSCLSWAHRHTQSSEADQGLTKSVLPHFSFFVTSLQALPR